MSTEPSGKAEQDLPPAALLISSPYDPDARYSVKRTTMWTGYKVHMTETCEDDEPHLIIHTETTLATTPDNAVTDTIHHALEGQALLPHTHLVDAGYLDAEMLVTSHSTYQVDMLGPVSLDGSWQAQAATGFDVTHFHIDWAAHRVSCPASRTSRWWMSSTDRHGKEAIRVKFAPTDCQICPLRLNCTRGQSRTLTLRPNPAEYQALHTARQRQSTPEFREQYARRAGVEGTISQAVRESRIAASSLHGTEESTPPSVHHRSGPEFTPDGGLVSRDPSCSHPHVPVCCAHRLCSAAASRCLGYNNSPTISESWWNHRLRRSGVSRFCCVMIPLSFGS